MQFSGVLRARGCRQLGPVDRQLGPVDRQLGPVDRQFFCFFVL